ncbi:MAG: efflux RND transporter permease subunit [Gemmatimonadetes bacterium]|nr:efflux RND transporter permease subunit [Gemmatimonadota bacterium]
MMGWIIGSSLQLRYVVITAASLLLVFGFARLTEMPVNSMPEFSRPYVEVQTEALGLSAQEVEAMITTPMEADMLNGAPWVDEIRSQSVPGLSSIVMVFEEGTDLMTARQVVQERLNEVYALPQVSKPPTMLNPTSSASRAIEVGLTSETQSLIEISVLARWTIVPRLMGLPGVANVSMWGQRKRQLQVQVDPAELRDQGVTLMQVIRTTGNSLWASPLSYLEASTPGTGGWIETPNQRLGVRHILPISTAEDLARVTLDGDATLRLGDVATVVEDHQPLIGDAYVGDASSLVLVVEKFPWANTVEVTEEVEEALVALQPGLGDLTMDATLYRPATYLEAAAGNFTTALLIGIVLAVLALVAFHPSWRVAVISAVAVTASVFTALGVLYVQGTVLNLMTVTGFLVAAGVMIDDVIIDMESVRRRMREGSGDASTATKIREALSEGRRPLVYATLIIVLFLLPVFFVEGVTAAFAQSLVGAFVLAIVASTLVAVTLTAALSVVLLPATPLAHEESRVGGALVDRLDRVSARATQWPRRALAGVGALAVLCVISIPLMRPGSTVPELREMHLLVRWEGSSSTSHPAMSRIAGRIGQEIRSIPGVREVSAQVGRAVMSDKRMDVNTGELWVSIDPEADHDATVAAVSGLVSSYPGLDGEVMTYLQAQVREELSGTRDPLVVRVYGEDLGVIREKAEQVQMALAVIDGVVDPSVDFPEERPTIEIEVDLDAAQAYGLKPGDVRRSAAVLLSGMEVGNLFEEQKVFDVVVLGTPETRHSLTSIEDLLIDTPGGGHVRLGEVAEVRRVPAVTVIHRDAASRRVDVTASVEGRGLGAVAADVERAIGEIDFPLEYRAELLGLYADRLAAERRMIGFAAVAFLLITLLVQAFTRSWQVAVAYFLTLPTALSGGVIVAATLLGGELSLAAMAGLLAVLAVAVRQGTTVMSRYQTLEDEGVAFGPELVRQATRERLGPVLLTSLAMGLLFLPFAVMGGVAGLEVASPMAVVALGGLVTTTLFTLAGLPALYLLFGAIREPDLGLHTRPMVSLDEEGDLASSAA